MAQTGVKTQGKVVEVDAGQRLDPINSYSAGGIRSRIRGFGRVTIEQTRKRTTGQRPDWGIKVMQRDLIPAVRENELQIIAILDRMLGRLGGEYF